MLDKAVEKAEVSGFVTLPYWDVPELSKLDRQGMTQVSTGVHGSPSLLGANQGPLWDQMLLSRAALLPLHQGGKRQGADKGPQACEERTLETQAVGGRS